MAFDSYLFFFYMKRSRRSGTTCFIKHLRGDVMISKFGRYSDCSVIYITTSNLAHQGACRIGRRNLEGILRSPLQLLGVLSHQPLSIPFSFITHPPTPDKLTKAGRPAGGVSSNGTWLCDGPVLPVNVTQQSVLRASVNGEGSTGRCSSGSL